MSSNSIRGITVEVGGNTAPLDKALKDVNKTSRDLQGELNLVNKGLKLDPTNTVLLSQKQKLLADSVDNTKDKLLKLKEAEKQVQQQFKEGKISEEQYRSFQRELVKTEAELKKTESQAKKTGDGFDYLGKKSKKMNSIMKGATVAAVGIGAGLVGMAVKAGEAADDINTLAKQTGLSTEEIQKFQYASDRIDVSMETLTGSMAKLTKNMSNAKDGGKAATEAFTALGVSFKDNVTGELRDNNDVFKDAIKALGNMSNETERDALAMQLFGKSAQDLNPLILGGADDLKKYGEEAEAAGLILSQEALDGANKFADGVDKLKATAMGSFGVIGGEIAESLVPVLEDVSSAIESIVSWIMDNQTVVLATIAAIGAGLVAWNVATMIQGVVSAIKAFQLANQGATIAQAALNLVMSLNPLALIVMLIAGLVAAIIVLWNTNEDFRNALIGAWENIKSAISTAINAMVKFFKGLIDFVKNNWQALLLLLANPFLGAFKLLYDNCDAFRNFVDNFINGIINFVTEKIPSFIDNMISWFQRLPSAMLDIGKNIVSGIWKGIENMAGWLWSKVTGFASGIVDGIKDALKINSPSQVFADEVGAYMAQGIGVGFESEMGNVSNNLAKSIPTNKQNYIDGLSGSNTNTTGTSVGSSAELTINTPIYLDSKVITNVVSKVQYQNGRLRARGTGVVTA